MNDWRSPYFDGITKMLNGFSTYIHSFYNNYYESIRETINAITGRFEELALNLQKWARPYNAIKKLADCQYVFWDYIDDEKVDLIIDSSNINKTLRELNIKSNFADIKDIAQRCLEKSHIKPYEKLFLQSMDAFENGNSELAILGFISIIDGLLSDVSNDTTPKIFQRADAILRKIEEDEDIDNDEFSVFALLITFRETMESFSHNSDFKKKEPKNLNRHWIMHGRSRRRKTKLDCIKTIRFIYGIILIDELSKKN